MHFWLTQVEFADLEMRLLSKINCEESHLQCSCQESTCVIRCPPSICAKYSWLSGLVFWLKWCLFLCDSAWSKPSILYHLRNVRPSDIVFWRQNIIHWLSKFQCENKRKDLRTANDLLHFIFPNSNQNSLLHTFIVSLVAKWIYVCLHL